MQRLGHIIVENDSHVLYAHATRRQIMDFIDGVTEAAIRQVAVVGPKLVFDVRQHLRGKSRNSRLLRELIVAEAIAETRAIFSDTRLSDEAILDRLANTRLAVIIESRSSRSFAVRPAPKGINGCRITCPEVEVRRTLENVLIDISIGHILCSIDPLHSLLKREGPRGLFLRKAQYAKLNKSRLPHTEIDKSACYFPLTLFIDPKISTPEQKAIAALGEWELFISSQSDVARIKSTAGRLAKTATTASLATLPQIGKQLPVRKIGKAAQHRPNGGYYLLVLVRSAGARRTPKIRNAISSVFGRQTRPFRTFAIIDRKSISGTQKVIEDLVAGGFIEVIPIEITDSQVLLRKS